MRAVIAVLLFACLAAGAWFVFDRSEIQLLPDAPITAKAGAPIAAAETQTAPVPNDKEQPAGAAVEADANQRQAVAPQFAGPVGEVQVVHFDTKTPIEKATVYCWPPDFEWWNPTARPQGLSSKDYDAFFERMRLALTTDGEGRCRVPLGSFGAQVTAVKDELWGQGHVPKDAAAPVVLALRADHTLRVLVVDAGGRPAGGVMVSGKHKDGDRPMSLWLGKTDAAGRLEHRHVQQLANEDTTAKIECVANMTGGGESAPVLVDVTAPPPEVVLQLPPGGTVTVHVRDAEGKPVDPTFLGEPNVFLTTFAEQPRNENAEIEGLNWLNRAYGGVRIDERGDAVFDPVALDRFVIASASLRLRSAVVPGPTLENPHIEVTVSEGADDVVLTGTLLDAQGMPYATSQFMATCKFRGMSAQRGLTDASGRFRISVTRVPPGQQIAVSFDTAVANRDAPHACKLPPRLLTKGRNDLGEVRLALQSILVEGRVVMADGGEPVQVPMLIERNAVGRWQQESNLQPEWGKAGAFTMRSGIAKGTPIRLSVLTNGFLPVAPIECAAGDTGLEITLRKGGSAHATFLVDDTLPLERLTLRFRPADPPQKQDSRAEMMERMQNLPRQLQAKDGRVQQDWQGLKPGRYRLQALCAGGAEPIVAIDAIEIADGPCTDPRLVDIDLRGRVRVFEIRATASDATPIASRDAFVVIRSSGDDWSGFQLAAGFVKIAAPAAVDLIVLAKGHKTAFVNGVFDARTIALEAAAEAHLALALPSPLPEGATLRLRLRPTLELPRRARMQLDNGRGMQAADFFVEEAIVDASGKATVPVRYPGSYTIEATLSFGQRGGAYIRDFEPPTITLPASGEVALRVGQEGFDRALEMARR